VIVLCYINSSDFVYKDSPTVVTIGNFDGFHKGHKILINKLNEIKLDTAAKSLIFSFRPRPVEVFKNMRIKSILSAAEKVEVASSLGIDIFVEYPFSVEFSKMSGEEFVGNILIERLNCKHIIVGSGFAFGKDRAWDAAKISDICKEQGIAFTALPHELAGEEKISSTTIRKYLENGEIARVNELLGYDYYALGEIRELRDEEPLIAVAVDDWKLLPKIGKYMVEISLKKDKTFRCIADIDSEVSQIYISPAIESYNNFSALNSGDKIVVNFKDYLEGET